MKNLKDMKLQREVTIKAARALCQQMLDEVLDAESVAALARHQAYLDVMTGSVPWEHAPADVMAKFVRQPTASDDEFNAVLNEAREARKK